MYLFVEFVGKGIGHHGLAGAGWTMKQHYHACTIGDGIVQPHALPAALVRLKVANCVQNQLLLLFRQNHLQKAYN